MTRFTKLAINAVIFQAGWFLSVLFGTPAAVFVSLSAVLIYARFFQIQRWDFLLFASIILLGVVGDTILGLSGALIYPSGDPYPPFWMATLWLLFATTIPWSLRWIAEKKYLFIVASVAGGTFSYIAGVKLSSVEFGFPFYPTILILLTLWALHGIAISSMFNLWNQKCTKI